MKKKYVILILLILGFCLTGCGNNSDSSVSTSSNNPTDSTVNSIPENQTGLSRDPIPWEKAVLGERDEIPDTAYLTIIVESPMAASVTAQNLNYDLCLSTSKAIDLVYELNPGMNELSTFDGDKIASGETYIIPNPYYLYYDENRQYFDKSEYPDRIAVKKNLNDRSETIDPEELDQIYAQIQETKAKIIEENKDKKFKISNGDSSSSSAYTGSSSVSSLNSRPTPTVITGETSTIPDFSGLWKSKDGSSEYWFDMTNGEYAYYTNNKLGAEYESTGKFYDYHDSTVSFVAEGANHGLTIDPSGFPDYLTISQSIYYYVSSDKP